MKYFAFVSLLVTSLVLATAEVGSHAPGFHTKDANGKMRSLKEFHGQWLVLEWYNKDCPYVRKHYGSGNMQKLQETYTKKGVAWLTVISSAEGKQGYLKPQEALENAKATASHANAILLDPEGKMGHAYGAKTTPHIFIIDPTSKLAYAGGMDDNDSSDPATVDSAKEKYVVAALDSALSGKGIPVKSSRPYGCSVKYK